MINQQQLKALLKYNKQSGLFVWRKCADNNKVKKGDVAGCVAHDGYYVIQLNKKLYLAHRLAWLYVHGEWPNHIDHINHNRGDNRIINIRSVTQAENLKNKPMSRNNTSGITGVAIHKRYNKWQATISNGKKLIHLGFFSNKKDAIAVRKAAEKKYGYHENHGKQPT